jgi:hypothetical protein
LCKAKTNNPLAPREAVKHSSMPLNFPRNLAATTSRRLIKAPETDLKIFL